MGEHQQRGTGGGLDGGKKKKAKKGKRRADEPTDPVALAASASHKKNKQPTGTAPSLLDAGFVFGSTAPPTDERVGVPIEAASTAPPPFSFGQTHVGATRTAAHAHPAAAVPAEKGPQPQAREKAKRKSKKQRQKEKAQHASGHEHAAQDASCGAEPSPAREEHEDGKVSTHDGVKHAGGQRQGQKQGQKKQAAPALTGKAAKRAKLMQHLKMGGEATTPAEKQAHPFEVDPTDHCETPFRAYRDVEALLFWLAQHLRKPKAELKIYDPYFCEGSIVKHMNKLGFMDVYNKNEDFYSVISARKTPDYDVLVTNPPYSQDHIPRIIRFAVKQRKPWLLLLPNFVCKRSNYPPLIGNIKPFYLIPNKSYTYFAPGRNTEKAQATTPFPSFWYCHMGAVAKRDETIRWWRKKYGETAGAALTEGPEELPEHAKPKRTEKRLNPRRRKALLAAGRQ